MQMHADLNCFADHVCDVEILGELHAAGSHK